MISLDLKSIVKKIENLKNSLENRSKAIFNATQISKSDLGGNRANNIIIEHTKLHKLEPWLNRAR